MSKTILCGIILVGAAISFSACTSPAATATLAPASTVTQTDMPAATNTLAPTHTATVIVIPPTATRTATHIPTVTPSPTSEPATSTPRATATQVKPSATATLVKPTQVPPTRKPTAVPTQVPPTEPPQGSACNVDAGNAGILVVNHFDGLMTLALLNHEYKLDGHTEQLIQVPGGQEFTVSVSVVGVGKTNFGPVSLNAGECVRYEPSN